MLSFLHLIVLENLYPPTEQTFLSYFVGGDSGGGGGVRRNDFFFSTNRAILELVD